MPAASSLFAASAGLDLLSGVFGYLSALNARDVASSRADMIRNEAEADAARYAEGARARSAATKMAYLGNGVTAAGSPVAVLDEQARLAQENVSAIKFGARVSAFDQELQGEESMMRGRNALIGGLSRAARGGYLGFGNATQKEQEFAAMSALLGGTH